jgi:putative SOS response-associated peptidase YedK
MCNRYETVSKYGIRTRFDVEPYPDPVPPAIGPLGRGDFITGAGARVGQWGLIPPTSPTRRPATPDGKPLSTNNARRERMATAPTFRGAWRKGQRCIIPAESYDEPYWGTGKNIWWRFWRADGAPWALAGLWDVWTDPATGELVPSFTMITQNCDCHPLLGLMHKPEVDKATGQPLPIEQQDKRCPVPLEASDWDAWLHGSVDQVQALIRVPALAVFRHRPADPAVAFELAVG